MKNPSVMKRLATILVLSALAASLVGCEDREAKKKEQAAEEYSEWVKKGAEFKAPEPKKSAF